MNKKGFTYIDMMITMMFLGLIALMTVNFNSYYKNHLVNTAKMESFDSHVASELSRLYAEGVDFSEEKIDTKYGEIQVSVTPQAKSEYGTNSSKVSFELGDYKREYTVERSEYAR